MLGDHALNRRYVLRSVLSRASSREAVDGTRRTRWLCKGVRGDNRDVSREGPREVPTDHLHIFLVNIPLFFYIIFRSISCIHVPLPSCHHQNPPVNPSRPEHLPVDASRQGVLLEGATPRAKVCSAPTPSVSTPVMHRLAHPGGHFGTNAQPSSIFRYTLGSFGEPNFIVCGNRRASRCLQRDV